LYKYPSYTAVKNPHSKAVRKMDAIIGLLISTV